MAIESKLDKKELHTPNRVEVVSKPDDFIIDTNNSKKSLYEKLSLKAEESTLYDAWCRHTD